MLPIIRIAALLWPVLPAAAMIRPAVVHAPYLQAYGGQVLGLGALACLLACLAVTPAAALVKLRQPGRWRQWYGLAMFALGAEGLVIAAAGHPGALGTGVTGDAQLWTGTLIVVLLLPVAATANRRAQKQLGAYWKTWQRRLVYAAWAAVAVHLAVLGAWPAGAALGLTSAPLAAARLPGVRGRLKRWRAGRLSRVLVPTAIAAFAIGFAALAWLEVTACARAIRLAPVLPGAAPAADRPAAARCPVHGSLHRPADR